jgi:hypothetical protein
VQSLHVRIGGQLQVPCCLRDTWWHFLLLKLLEMCDGLLDYDGCIAALNRLTLLEKLELEFQAAACARDPHCCNRPPSAEGIQL